MDHRRLTLRLTTKPHPLACPSWACHPGVGAVRAGGSLQQWSRGGWSPGTSFSPLQSLVSQNRSVHRSTCHGVLISQGNPHSDTWTTLRPQSQPPGCISSLLKVTWIGAEC